MAAKKADPKAQQKKSGKDSKPAKKKEVKKWVKTVTKEKVLRNVIINEDLYGKIKKEVGNMSVVTPATISTKYNLILSLAKKILDDLTEKQHLEVIAKSSFGTVYGKREALAVAVEEEKAAA